MSGKFKKHVFVCQNIRNNSSRKSCGLKGVEIHSKLKKMAFITLKGTDRLVGFLGQRGIELTFTDGHWTLVMVQEIGVEKAISSDVEEIDTEISDEPSPNLVVDDLPAILPEDPIDSRSSVDKPEPLDDLLVE